MKTLTLKQLAERASDLLDQYHIEFDTRLGKRFDNIICIIESYN